MNLKNKNFTAINNCQAISLDEISILDESVFFDSIVKECNHCGSRVNSFFAFKNKDGQNQLIAILGNDHESTFLISSTILEKDYFYSISEQCPQAQLFEREIAEQFGIDVRGHSRFNRVRFHRSFYGKEAWPINEKGILPSVIPYVRVEGDDIHEVAVGPVHAGIIEPGHFRFQCHGEKVFNLEISLGYQHRGIEKMMINGPNKKSIHFIETLAGDSTIAHTLAYCHALEALGGLQDIPIQALIIRGLLLELERIANHVGDIGALANDVAFLSTAAYCGRIRGDFLNMTALMCGNRFGRGALTPGGIQCVVTKEKIEELKKRFKIALSEFEDAAELLFESASAMERFEHCGILSYEIANLLGIVGVAARASGIARDARFNYPCGIYKFAMIPPVTYTTGDVYARALVRHGEIMNSSTFILEHLNSIKCFDNEARKIKSLRGNMIVVSAVEGWRGEVCHTVITNSEGKFLRYKVVDPSFHNWIALEMAMRNELIYNFPLSNKSFNLSYCGFDL